MSVVPTNKAARINEIRARPKTLRDKAMDRIFPPHHEHEFLQAHQRANARVRQMLGKEEDQIRRTEMVTGGEPGGPCISEAHTAGANSTKGMATEVCRRTCARSRT